MKKHFLLLFVFLSSNLYLFGQSCLVESECNPDINDQSICEDIVGGLFDPNSEDCSSVLPVELVFFKGTATKLGIELYWQTASELINEGFEVQRSQDAKTWEILDFVKGYGTSLEVQNYQWTDTQVAENTNYYRLKQMDSDGEFEYSEIIAFNQNGIVENTLVISPNPVSTVLEYQITGTGQAIEAVSIYNLTGQLVKEATYQDGFLMIDALESGTYILIIESGNRRFRSSFVKQ